MHPGIFNKYISTQQSTWMALKDGSGVAGVVKDGSGAATLGGGVGQSFKIAAAALVGSGSRRTCNDGIGVSIVKAEGLLLQHRRQS